MSERKKVCLDPGHDAGNLANRSPDGTYYEHEFCLDMGRRIRDILEDSQMQKDGCARQIRYIRYLFADENIPVKKR